MATDTMVLLLTEREAEVVEEALALYLSARPAPADARYEYRYRAAQSVLGNLQGNRRLPEPLLEEDEAAARTEDRHPRRRPRSEQSED
jgi:hypothetical protein